MAGSAVSAITSTDVQYPALVNGYLCYSAAEVRAARQMINPRALTENSSANATDSTTVAVAASTTPGLHTYTAQGADATEDERKRQRGSVLDVMA